MSSLYGRPTAAELVAAVADFLDNDVRDAPAEVGSPTGQVDLPRPRRRERAADRRARTARRAAAEVTAALGELGFADETRWRPPSAPATSTAGQARCCRAYARWCITGLRSTHPGYDEP